MSTMLRSLRKKRCYKQEITTLKTVHGRFLVCNRSIILGEKELKLGYAVVVAGVAAFYSQFLCSKIEKETFPITSIHAHTHTHTLERSSENIES